MEVIILNDVDDVVDDDDVYVVDDDDDDDDDEDVYDDDNNHDDHDEHYDDNDDDDDDGNLKDYDNTFYISIVTNNTCALTVRWKQLLKPSPTSLKLRYSARNHA